MFVSGIMNRRVERLFGRMELRIDVNISAVVFFSVLDILPNVLIELMLFFVLIVSSTNVNYLVPVIQLNILQLIALLRVIIAKFFFEILLNI